MLTIRSEAFLQRLFSTFANGWPGAGLLLQRALTAVLLVRFAVLELTGKPFAQAMIPPILAACAGILLVVGLWTPIAGTIIAVIELWIASTTPGDPWISIALAVFGGTIAMIGPGAWSLDARLFGRKHIAS